jgi:hypothetical protein
MRKRLPFPALGRTQFVPCSWLLASRLAQLQNGDLRLTERALTSTHGRRMEFGGPLDGSGLPNSTDGDSVTGDGFQPCSTFKVSIAPAALWRR